MFKDFDKRLERDIKRLCNARHKQNTLIADGSIELNPLNVKVVSHSMQRYAVWFGGSILASTPNFYAAAHTKQKYDEYGPSICRHNPVFGAFM